MKFPKIMIIGMCLLFFTVILLNVSELFFGVSISYYGLSVDKERNIYVGQNSLIQVLDENGNVIRKIDPPTSRGYDFAVKDDNIIFDIGDYVYVTDLYGNVISKTEIDYENDNRPQIRTGKRMTVGKTEYVREDNFLRPTIYRIENGQKIKVFEMPILNYVIKIYTCIAFPSLFIIYPIGIFKTLKLNKEKIRANSIWAKS